MSNRASTLEWQLRHRPRLPIAAASIVLLLFAAPPTARAAGPEPERTGLVATDGGSAFDDSRQDAVLVGLRVTIDKFWGRWDVIFSVQPIYRLKNGELVRGAVHGTDRGVELVSQAKPGYAVGRLFVAHGGRLDGLRCVFMRQRDGKLDPNDHYDGRWIGAKSDHKPDELASSGKLVIGIQGRAEAEVCALGLLLAPNSQDK